MVQLRALFTSLALLLLIFSSPSSVQPLAAATGGAHKRGQEKHGKQHRIPRINHGSFRGPRKHLVDPAVEHPFQVSKFPV